MSTNIRVLNEVAKVTRSKTAQLLLAGEHFEELANNPHLHPEVVDQLIAANPSASALTSLVYNQGAPAAESFNQLATSKLATVRAAMIKNHPELEVVTDRLATTKELTSKESQATWFVYQHLPQEVRANLAKVGEVDFSMAYALSSPEVTAAELASLLPAEGFTPSRRLSRMVPHVLEKFPTLLRYFLDSVPASAAGSFALAYHPELVNEYSEKWLIDTRKNVYALMALLANPGVRPEVSKNLFDSSRELRASAPWYSPRESGDYEVGSTASEVTGSVARSILRRAARHTDEYTEQTLRLPFVAEVLSGSGVTDQEVGYFYENLVSNLEYNPVSYLAFNQYQLARILPHLSKFGVDGNELSEYLDEPTCGWASSSAEVGSWTLTVPSLRSSSPLVCEGCDRTGFRVSPLWESHGEWSSHLHVLEDEFGEDTAMWSTAFRWLQSKDSTLSEMAQQVSLIHS